MEQMRWRTEEDTKAFAQQLAQDARPGQVIALRGDLGTGKTALTRFLAQALGVREHITSPTYTIVREYRSGRLPHYHFDVYRIEDPEEMFELGYEEYFYGDGLCVIEWADRIAELLPEDTLDIRLEYGSTPQERLVTVRRPAERS